MKKICDAVSESDLAAAARSVSAVYDGPGERSSMSLAHRPVDAVHRERRHRETMERRRRRLRAVRRNVRGDDEDPVELQRFARRQRRVDVPEMDRDPACHRGCRCARPAFMPRSGHSADRIVHRFAPSRARSRARPSATSRQTASSIAGSPSPAGRGDRVERNAPLLQMRAQAAPAARDRRARRSCWPRRSPACRPAARLRRRVRERAPARA